MRVDLNADVGESHVGAPTSDAAVLRSITSANVAAGFHAGDPSSIRATIRLARQYGVAVGAHPSLPDRDGFGRREIHVDPLDINSLVLYQIAGVAGIAAAEGVMLQHVKPHGALYNMAARDPELASAVVAAIATFDVGLTLFAPPRSHLLAAGRAAGLRVVAEAFVDRAYEPDGSLVARSIAGAIIRDPEIVVARAVRMVTDRTVIARDGSILQIDPSTLCIHGDTEGAAVLASRVRAGLEAAQVTVQAPGRR
jgi:UPF0271 protein